MLLQIHHVIMHTTALNFQAIIIFTGKSFYLNPGNPAHRT